MMTPDQRYFFDLTGYLHLRDVLSPAELAPAQAAADRYISMPPAEWPPEFGADLTRRDLTGYQHGFAFDQSLEVLTRHPATWPILMELTDRRRRASMAAPSATTATAMASTTCTPDGGLPNGPMCGAITSKTVRSAARTSFSFST